MDLDLNHYSLDDLLTLFHLPPTFTSSQLKEARKKVVAVHPDKSGLDKSYFIFFHKAYTMLNTVYAFRQKATSDMKDNGSFSDILETMEETDKRAMATTFTRNPNFSKEFNELFETLYVRDEDGYQEWLKSEVEEISFQDRKNQSRAIVVSEIECANTPHYSDLKKVYTVDTVIGVSEEDYKPGYSLQELKQSRSISITPLNKEEAERRIAHTHERESKEATEIAFQLLQQEENNQRHQKLFWSKLLRLG